MFAFALLGDNTINNRSLFLFFPLKKKEHEFIRLHISKYTMVVIVVNEQCNTGDPLETSGGLYRGPPSNLCK